MFVAVRMNITDKQGSRTCLMNTTETSFVADQPELVTAMILLSLKRAVYRKPRACWMVDEACVVHVVDCDGVAGGATTGVASTGGLKLFPRSIPLRM
jgi:hypothetical protein